MSLERSAHQFESVVSEFVLIAHVKFLQERAVAGHGAQRHIAELLTAVRRVFDQTGTVRRQRANAVILNVTAVGDVDLSDVLPPGRDLHQEIVFNLRSHRQQINHFNIIIYYQAVLGKLL